jgi:imidazolonepropionase-like amidohydrolase
MKTDPEGYMEDVRTNPLIVNVTPPHYLKNHNEGGIEALLAAHKSLGDAILQDIKSPDEMRKDSIAWTKIMVDEGMLVGLGTDVPYGGMWSGDALHREMEIWVNESGVSPLRTIQAVTYDNARIMKFDDRTGSIQPGMEADLLVVRGNPASNISDTRNIEYIFSNGKLVDRESLTRQWKP